MGATNVAAQAVLDSVFQQGGALGNAPTPPGGAGGAWVALATALTSEPDGTFTEVTGTGYARVQVPWTSFASASLADPSILANDVLVDMGTGGAGGWSGGVNITHFVLMDASTAGVAWFVGVLDTPKPVADGDPVSFAIGDLRFSAT